MKNVVLIVISICLFNLPLMAQNKTLDELLEKHKGKEGISEIKALVDKDINAKNNVGATALMYATWIGSGYTEIVKILIESGAKVNIKSNNGYTALMVASEEGHTEIVELLKEAGAKE